jgi:cell division protein FtsA
MATTDFIAAIELSSSKISGIAGKKNSDGSIQVLACAREDASSFIRKGVIYNIDKTAQALTSIINKLESQLDNSIAKVYVGIGGQSLRTVRNAVSREQKEEGIISQELVDAISDENLEVPLMDMHVLDVAPQEYRIDNNFHVDPVGVAGKHITGHFLNIVARSSLKKNLEHSFEQAKIEIADLFIAPMVLANAVLTESERRSGCALVDFGADTTTVSVYKNNILRFLAVIPLGGNNISHDIATLQMEESEAEQLKIKYGDLLFEDDENEAPTTCTLEDGRIIEINELNNIIEARIEEILANVWNQLQLSGYEDKLLSGIVFTGGGSNLKNIEEIFRKRSKIDKVKTVKFVHDTVYGFNDFLQKDGRSNTLLGLLAAGSENCCLLETKPVKQQPEALEVYTTYTKSVDIFNDDEALKEQEAAARAAKAQREKEEKERKEQERREKEKREKEEKRKKKKEGPGWLEKTFNKLSNEIFSDDDMK